MAIDPNLISPDEFMDSSDDEPEEEEEEEIDEVGRPLDVAEDGKVVKTITSLGTGRLKPGPGAVVSLYYTATLDDGTPVATHARPKAPFQFTLGAGEVSKGWDCGVATMKKGEQATLRCAPEYAGGPPAAAGPDAAVRFDVELVSWVEWKDVSELQDGTIMKTIVTEGGGARTPDFDAVVTVSWRLTLEDPTGDATPEALEEKEGVVFTVGAEEVAPKGLEKAVQTMLDGEEAVVRLGPAEGYGAGGDARLRVPPDAPVYYALAVRDVRLAPQVWDLDTHEAKLQRAALLKDEGNALFKGGKTSRAVKKYQAAMSFVETEYELTEAEKEAQKPVKTSLHLNLAACGVKAGMWVSVVDNCEEALRLQPGHTKALLRRGKAHVGLEMWRDAQLDFEAVLATEGSAEIPDAKRELARLKQKMRQQDQKERGAFQGLFDKIRVAEAEPQEPAAAEPPQAEAPVSCCSAGTCGGTK